MLRCYDSWHLDRPLFQKYGLRIAYDSASCSSARLSKFILNGQWNRPHARFEDLVQIQCKLWEVQMGGFDRLECLPAARKVFSCKKNWKAILEKRTSVNWWNLVWFSKIMSKQTFLLVSYAK